jgi:putative flippase GtrA
MPDSLGTIGNRLLSAWHRRAVGLKAVSFACIGVVNTAIDYSLFLFAYEVVAKSVVTANVLPWLIVPSNVFAWFVAVSASYVMNSFVTFAKESGRKLRWNDYRAFVTSGVASVIASSIVVQVGSVFVEPWVAKLFAIPVSFLVNFSLTHLVVFPHRRGDPRSQRG